MNLSSRSLIKSVCVSQSVSMYLSACEHSARSHFLIDFHQNWHRRKYPQKEERVRCNNMPILCQLAELYLGMASSSVPVECLFSSAALFTNGKRSSLKPYKLEHILFVHQTVCAKINSANTGRVTRIVQTGLWMRYTGRTSGHST